MHFDFNEDQRFLHQTVRDFLEAECPADRIRGFWDTETGRSPELWNQLAELGIQSWKNRAWKQVVDLEVCR